MYVLYRLYALHVLCSAVAEAAAIGAQSGRPADQQLNSRVALWNGQILLLETDGLVNSANRTLSDDRPADWNRRSCMNILKLNPLWYLFFRTHGTSIYYNFIQSEF